ncbi:hypothetical protein J2T13_000852 [Paenibacillus sp. DS2015]|uniref:hypothetical protein n=1 Tax=Paenibacillus sp. DS2015 TaxID=3373917 RepID=UPI003D21521F
MSRDPRDWQADMEMSLQFTDGHVQGGPHDNGKSVHTFGLLAKEALPYWLQESKNLCETIHTQQRDILVLKNELKKEKEDNARWTCKHTAAEQKYQTQANVIAELRKELDIELRGRVRWSEVAKRLNDDVVAGKGRADKAEEREQKLKECMERVITIVDVFHDSPDQALLMRGSLQRELSALYPLDREDTNESISRDK